MAILQRLSQLAAATGKCCSITRKRLTSLVVLLFLVTLFFVGHHPAPRGLEGMTIRVYLQDAVNVADPYSGVEKGDLSWLKTPDDFFIRLENEQGQTLCKKMVKAGGRSCRRIQDGIKYICLDHDVALNPRDCVAYSFGISDDISFDDKAARFGCRVFMMDPTVEPVGKYDHLTGKQKFFSLGIGNANRMNPFIYKDPKTFEQRLSNITFLTYSALHDVTGYRGPVHYFKMDVEGSEWSSMKYIMDNNLFVGTQQLMVEIHLLEVTTMKAEELMKSLKQKWLFLERLEDHGFLRVRYDPTPPSVYRSVVPSTNRTMQVCGELFLVRRNRRS